MPTADYQTVVVNRVLLGEMQALVKNYFASSVDYFKNMDLTYYRSRIALAQDVLNERGLVNRLASDLGSVLAATLDLPSADHLMVQSHLYLRAARPVGEDAQEVVDFHRESFYGGQREAWNVWVPVLNVSRDNTLRYVPNSADIPDEQITTIDVVDGSIPKHSPGHKIGLLYRPKRITGGVDLSKSIPMTVPVGQAAVFSSALVHGAGVNHSDQIRFSVDFRVIAEKHVRENKFHFASGADYFVPLKA